MKFFISGMPDLKLGLNDKIGLEKESQLKSCPAKRSKTFKLIEAKRGQTSGISSQSSDGFVSSIAEKILNSPLIVALFTTPPAPSCSLCRSEFTGVNLVRRRRRRVRRAPEDASRATRAAAGRVAAGNRFNRFSTGSDRFDRFQPVRTGLTGARDSPDRSTARPSSSRSIKPRMPVFTRRLCGPEIILGLGRCELLEMWVMKEHGVVESWTKVLSLYMGDRSELFSRVLGFRNNGEVLLQVYEGEMAPFDLNRQLIEPHGVKIGEYFLSVESYMESLVLLDKAVGVCSVHDECYCKLTPLIPYRYIEAFGLFLLSKLDDDPKGTPIAPYPSMADLLLQVPKPPPIKFHNVGGRSLSDSSEALKRTRSLLGETELGDLFGEMDEELLHVQFTQRKNLTMHNQTSKTVFYFLSPRRSNED
ncbi:hypothetical protein F3Y22_tig00110384pilonHSYRG00247 [Hibiscus syriacus]|uniref:F-box associated domain-containing protein n=1 Tax=Hibiscus syriacus TaxID=106335 RepID=A0A6A3ARH6_HIBSY|nr:hypothetical protein F3Y22_tig00110384pilonHSYRG00247 [Hibiscus syriacus]